MVGINAINISAGISDLTVTPPEPKSSPSNTSSAPSPQETVTVTAGLSASEGEPTAAAQLEPIVPNADSGPREVQIEDNVVLRIAYDDDSGRFVYSGVDKETGDVVRQYPPEGVLKLLAQNRVDAAGLLVDEETWKRGECFAAAASLRNTL